MRILIFFTFLPLLSLCLSNSVYPQENILFDPLKDDISSSIPPLEVLIDSAISNNFRIKANDQQLTYNEYKMNSKRIEWTKNVFIRGSTGYGNMYDYTSSETTAIDPQPIATFRNQTYYNASINISIPISTIVDRNNQLRMVNAEINQARSLIEEQKQQIRQLVIIHLNELVLNQRLFVLKANKVESIKANMQMAETQFMNGVIPLSEYTQLNASVSETEVDYEKARMAFLNSYMILEEIVGFKFNLFKTSPGNDEHN